MNANPKRLSTRIFRAGDSQAVGIPKAFELPEGDALIERRPGGLFIRLKQGGWEEFFAKPPLQADLDPVELRAAGPERAVNLGLSAKRRRSPRRTK